MCQGFGFRQSLQIILVQAAALCHSADKMRIVREGHAGFGSVFFRRWHLVCIRLLKQPSRFKKCGGTCLPPASIRAGGKPDT